MKHQSTQIFNWKIMQLALFFLMFSFSSLSAETNCPNAPNPQIITDVNHNCGEERDHQENAAESIFLKPKDDCINVCEFSEVTYEGIVGSSSTILWQVFGGTFASGYTATSNPVNIDWGSVGNGIVRLTETDNLGCTTTTEICININEGPTAKFVFLPDDNLSTIKICEGGDVYFEDRSSSDVVRWEWDFGDGQTSSVQHPTVTYNSPPGIYVVTLTVYNDCDCSDTYTLDVEVLDGWTPIVECISTECTEGNAVYRVTNACPGAVITWNTTNGGPSVQTGNPVSINWGSAPSGYLEVSVANCPDICPAPAIVWVPIIGPGLSISGPTTVCEDELFQLSVPYQPGSVFEWDNNSSTIISRNNTVDLSYSFPGTYTVNVKITSPGLICPSQSEYLTIIITVLPKFILTMDDVVCLNQDLAVSSSAGPGTTFVAIDQFNNSTSLTYSGGQLNTSILAAGTYQIVGTAAGYCNKPSKVIQVSTPAILPLSSDVSGTFTVCPNSTHEYQYNAPADMVPNWSVVGGTIQGNPSNPTLVVLWGNGPTFEIKLSQTHIDNVDCPSPEITIPVYEFQANPLQITTTPNPGVTDFCANGFQDFTAGPSTNVTDYQWSITPSTAASVISGDRTANIEVEFHNYNGAGTLHLLAKVCDTWVPSSYPLNITSITASLPNNLTFCQNDSYSPVVSFSPSLPSGTTASYSYYLDGVAAGSSINFTTPGSHSISADITLSGGSCDGLVLNAGSTVIVNPAPITNISAPNGTVLTSSNPSLTLIASAQFDASNPSATYSYTWSNSTSGSTTTVTSAGTYTVTVTDSVYGCTAEESISISNGGQCQPCTASIPAIVFTESCGQLSASIPYTSSSYSWSFGDGNTATGSNSVSHTYTTSGIYSLQVIVEVSPGVLCRQTTTVVVNYIPRMNYNFYCDSNNDMIVNIFDQTDFIVAPSSLNFSWNLPIGATLISSNTNNTSIEVDFGTLTSPQTVSHTVTRPSSSESCTVSELISFPSPVTAAFTLVSPRCVEADVLFNTTYSNNESLLWNFGDGASSTNNNPTRAYSTTGVKSVTLSVADKYGCVDTHTDNVTILANPYASGLLVTPAQTSMCDGNSVNLVSSPISPYTPVNYSWTNYITNNVGTNSPNYNNVTTTGEYQLAVEDNIGCKDVFSSAQVMVTQPPLALIRGKVDHCEGDPFELNGYAGNDLNYLWTMGFITYSGPIFSGPAADPYHGQTVTLTVSDGNCSSTDTYTFNVLQGPNITVTTIDPCIPASYSVSSTDPGVTYVWSNGQTGNNATFNSGGTESVTAYSLNGCSTTKTFNVQDIPDVTDIAVGCYCFEKDLVVWQLAPIGNYSYHITDSDGNVYLDNGDGTVTFTKSEVYTVVVTNNVTGCSTETEEIILDLGGCEECKFTTDVREIKCIGVDALTGLNLYSYEIEFHNFGIGLNGLAGTSQQGVVYNGTITPNFLPGNSNTLVTGTFAANDPNKPFCIEFTGIGDHGITCSDKICFELPECKSCEGCDLELAESKVECINTINDRSFYEFSIDYYKGKCDIIDLFWEVDREFELSFDFNSISANTSGQLTGFMSLPTGMVGGQWFQIKAVNPMTGEVCYYEVYFEIPDCEETDPCKDIDINEMTLSCVGTDSYGNKVYEYHLDANSSINDGNIFVLPLSNQPENQISSLSTIVNGQHYVADGLIVDAPKFNGKLCFYIVIYKDGKFCHTKICVEAPKPCGFSSSASTRSNDSLDGIDGGLQLYPNPANRYVELSINYNIISYKNIEVKVVNQLGQVVHHIKNISAKSQFPIDISNDQNGIYNAIIISNGEVIDSKKYIVSH